MSYEAWFHLVVVGSVIESLSTRRDRQMRRSFSMFMVVSYLHSLRLDIAAMDCASRAVELGYSYNESIQS